MKKLLFLFLSAVVLFATGCPENAPKFDVTDENYKKLMSAQLKQYIFQKEWVEYKCLNDGYYNYALTNVEALENSKPKNKKGGKGGGTVAPKPNATVGFLPADCFNTNNPNFKPSSQRAANVRNEVIDNSLALINSTYDVYIRNIRKNRSIGEFLADLVQIGGSTAVGIVNGERAIQVIGVALTGFSAGRKSASLNFYDEKTTTVLIKRMDASRSIVLGEIKQSQRKSTDDYSFDAALDDIVRYFDAGTLNRAFVELDKQTSVDAEIARQGVLKVKKIEDVNNILTPAERAVIKNLNDKMAQLEKDLDLTTDTDENKQKIDAAGVFLKSVYEKAAIKPEFNEIFTQLRNIANAKVTDTLITGDRLKELQETFKKIDSKKAVGKDYYAVARELSAKANNDQTKKLLEIFNEVNTKE